MNQTLSSDQGVELDQIDLFISGRGDYHTYRIPAIVGTPGGTVLAFCEGRKHSSSDAGDINVLLRRSLDGGTTWEPIQIIWDDGPNTCGNPCPVVDRSNGTIWLLLTHNLGVDREREIWAGTSQGTRTVWITKSTNEGETWSVPVEITEAAKAANGSWYATGPGVGIQLQRGRYKGRLVVPCDHGIAGGYDYHAHIIYSDDHGETWHLGGSVPDDTTSECQVVELSNGALMLNIRNHDASPERKKIADNDFTWADRTKDPYRRTIALSFDGGLTWNNVRKDPTLLDPHCQASLLHHADSGSLIFSNPASTTRRRMTVRLSDDEGKTWTSSKLLHAGPSAYSCLTILPHGILGCLYERGDTAPYEKITLARFTLEWAKTPPMSMPPRGHSIPLIDLSQEPQRQVIVEKQPDQYLGHPTTVLLSDGRTILCTYPLGHGGPSAVLKKSTDGGLTWSERLSVPDNWETARNCPCLHRLTDADGVERLFVIEGNGDMRQAVSQDNGVTWTPFEPNGLHCVVAPITIVPITENRHLALYVRCPRDGADRPPLTIWQSVSTDGGLTWEDERRVGEMDGADPDEPCVFKSPDGKQLCALMRENSRRLNSLMMISNDEGETWSELTELPGSLTGDRHMPRYAHDGRLVVAFRDMAHDSPTRGDFVAWVGRYEDLHAGREGQYRLRLLQHHGRFGDCGYPGLEVLPDGTFVATTYVVHKPDEQNSVVSVRFKLDEIDAIANLHTDE